MKRIILSSLGILLFTFSFSQKKKSPEKNMTIVPQEVNVHSWIEKNFAKGKVPPFSFNIGGMDSKDVITKWDYKAETIKGNNPNVENFVYTYSDRSMGTTIKCFVTGFNDFNAVEWMLKISANADMNTPVIAKQKVADLSFASDKAGAFYLHYLKGSDALRSDFEYQWAKLRTDTSVYMTPAGGRSSDKTGFPFFNIELPSQEGVIVSIGWTGKWYADVKLKDEKTAGLAAGMEKINTILYPGEEIRTPKVSLLFWKGQDKMVGQNKFRKFILAHHTRKANGKNIELPLAFGLGFGGPPPCNEYSCATEQYCVAMVNRHKLFKMVPDVFWIDAGWYQGCGTWYEHVGNWTINKNNFPNGFKPVSDEVHKAGAKFIVWFEPERVVRNTEIANEHPEFLLKLKDTSKVDEWGRKNSIFNLGNKEALVWMTNRISGIIKEGGIDHYRQDFNIDPMIFWEQNDKPGRIGMSEIRHIEGLYAFWDSLLTRFPNLLIDNCASGGRRIDLETTSRSSPLWRTDYAYGEPNGYQCHTYGLNFFLPLHGTGNFKTTTYDFRSSLSSGMVIGMDISTSGEALAKNMKDYKRLQPYYSADYYPLTDYYGNESVTSDKVWLAYQLNRIDKNDGIILAFRRSECDKQEITVKLKGLDPNANYEVFFEDYNIKFVKSGAELMNGLGLASLLKPGSLLVSYKKL